jgi:hypothetical protein
MGNNESDLLEKITVKACPTHLTVMAGAKSMDQGIGT